MRTGHLPFWTWAAACAALLAGCSAPVELTSPAVDTPYSFSSNKVFYLGDPVNAAGDQQDADLDYRELLTDVKIADRIAIDRRTIGKLGEWDGLTDKTLAGLRGLLDAQASLPPGIARPILERVVRFASTMRRLNPTLDEITDAYESQLVKHNDPLAIIVNSVRLPADGRGRRDIAVVLDVESSTEIDRQQLVVFYQRDVPEGHALNFADLLVYFDPDWDSTNPVEFRLRVIDVMSERNERVRRTLERADSLVSSMEGLVPHPAIPGIEVAIEAARMILTNRNNRILLDYVVQFHSLATFEGSNAADMGLLRRGSWLVIGRPNDTDDRFWSRSIFKQRHTDELIAGPLTPDSTATGERLPVPSFEVTISTADVQVPRSVLDRSEQLTALLATRGKDDPDSLESAMSSLQFSIRAYAADRRLKKYRTLDDLGALIDLLYEGRALDSAEAEAMRREPMLATDQRRMLLSTVRRAIGPAEWTYIGEGPQRRRNRIDELIAAGDVSQAEALRELGSSTEVYIKDWWNHIGRFGRIDPNASSTPLGFIWRAAEPAP